MIIRTAQITDLPGIMAVYAQARKYMAENGNAAQWGAAYPSEELVKEDIRLGQCFVGTDDKETRSGQVLASLPQTRILLKLWRLLFLRELETRQ